MEESEWRVPILKWSPSGRWIVLAKLTFPAQLIFQIYEFDELKRVKTTEFLRNEKAIDTFTISNSSILWMAEIFPISIQNEFQVVIIFPLKNTDWKQASYSVNVWKPFLVKKNKNKKSIESMRRILEIETESQWRYEMNVSTSGLIAVRCSSSKLSIYSLSGELLASFGREELCLRSVLNVHWSPD